MLNMLHMRADSVVIVGNSESGMFSGITSI